MTKDEIKSLNPKIHAYMGFKKPAGEKYPEAVIEEYIKKTENISQFKYIYKYFDVPPEFLQKEPYITYLSGSKGVIIAVMTLGIAIDRLIKRLMKTSPAEALIMSACGSAYLEYRSDSYEKTIGEELGRRFCPGYGGSSVEDLKYIFEIMKPEKIGVILNNSNFMVPSKSMAGIISVGKTTEKSCGGCIMSKECKYLKEGTVCYR